MSDSVESHGKNLTGPGYSEKPYLLQTYVKNLH